MLHTPAIRAALAIFISLGIVLGLAYVGVPQMLGAHPWWGLQTAAIGAPIGALIALVLWRAPVTWRSLGFTGLLAISGGVATLGKARFAASYAEDVFAGHMWYFGWIAIAASMAALVTTFLLGRR